MAIYNHWSCTPFADYIRGIKKPESASTYDWDRWNMEAKNKHPIRYYIAETLLDKIQDFFNYPKNKFNELFIYFNNRYISKTHALTSNLKRGQWHDFDTRLLHCSFDALVDFVEIEQAWHNILSDAELRKKYNVGGFWRRRFTRSPESGIDYLKWASELKYDENMGLQPGDKEYNQPTTQAIAAMETLTLYQWWKHVRPNRPDPYAESGWKDYCDTRRANGIKVFFSNEKDTPEMAKQKTAALEKLDKLERAYELEDTIMLKRLVDLRRSLWT